MNYRFKSNSNIDAYGNTDNVIHFKFGDCRKHYHFTDEFVKKYPEFSREFESYWIGQDSVFDSPFDVVGYIERFELPVRLYSNYYDEEFEDIDAVREWLMYEHGTRDMEKSARLYKGLEAK